MERSSVGLEELEAEFTHVVDRGGGAHGVRGGDHHGRKRGGPCDGD